MDPRLVKQAMKKMGMKQEDIPAHEVLIKCGDKNLIIRNPNVQKIVMMNEVSFQITGDVEESSAISEEDIHTVMQQASCSKEDARKALEKTQGDLAEAILDLQS